MSAKQASSSWAKILVGDEKMQILVCAKWKCLGVEKIVVAEKTSGAKQIVGAEQSSGVEQWKCNRCRALVNFNGF